MSAKTTPERLPKSGNVTIKLSRREVETLLKGAHMYPYPYGESTIHSKVRRAVRSKFSNVEAELAEETRAANIVFGFRDSDEWKLISNQFHEERQKLNELYDTIGRNESKKFQELAQVKLDEAGVKSYRAIGFGFTRVKENEE